MASHARVLIGRVQRVSHEGKHAKLLRNRNPFTPDSLLRKPLADRLRKQRKSAKGRAELRAQVKASVWPTPGRY